MRNHKLPLYVYSENPLALRYLTRLLRPARASIFPFPCNGRETDRDHPQAFILIADEGCDDVSKQRTLHLVRETSENVRTLVIGHPASTLHLRQLILAGVHGFIGYGHVESQLKPAIEALRRGRLWMPARGGEVDNEPRAGMGTSGLSCGPPLTAQERIILDLLGRNLSNKEIGSHLRISERTVKFHLSNIFDKFGVRDRHSAVSLAEALASPLLATDQKQTHTVPPSKPMGLAVITVDASDTVQPLARAAKAGSQ